MSKSMGKSLLKRILPADATKFVYEAMEEAKEELYDICKRLDYGRAAEIDTSKISGHTVKKYVAELMRAGKLDDEYVVKTLVRESRHPESRRCFILRMKHSEVQAYRKRYESRRRAIRVPRVGLRATEEVT